MTNTRPRSRRRLLAAGAVTATALVGSLVATIPVSGAATGSTSERHAATTVERRSPAKVLKHNRLYKLKAMKSVGCAPQSAIPLDSDADMIAYYKTELTCLNHAWKKELKRLKKHGVRFKAPKLKVNTGTTRSKCGVGGRLSYYCPADRTIYMYDREIVDPWNSDTDPTYRAYVKLAGTHTLAHEYGHHIQNLVGIFGTIDRRYRGQTERRAELQASCLGNVFLSAQRDAYPVSAEALANRQWWAIIQVANHGTSADQGYWITRGYDSAKPGHCNTFKAKGRLVR